MSISNLLLNLWEQKSSDFLSVKITLGMHVVYVTTCSSMLL